MPSAAREHISFPFAPRNIVGLLPRGATASAARTGHNFSNKAANKWAASCESGYIYEVYSDPTCSWVRAIIPWHRQRESLGRPARMRGPGLRMRTNTLAAYVERDTPPRSYVSTGPQEFTFHQCGARRNDRWIWKRMQKSRLRAPAQGNRCK